MELIPISITVGVGLFFILHLVLLDQLGQSNLWSLHFLGLVAIVNLLWQKKEIIKLNSSLFSTCFGSTLIVLVLLRSQMPLGYNPHLSLFVGCLGLVSLASGIKGIHQYKAEFIVISFLFFYPLFSKILMIINLPVLTAKMSNFMLNLLGFTAEQQNTLIILPTGRLEVYGGCSGIELLLLLVLAALLFCLNFPLGLSQAIASFFIAILAAFLGNSLRVAFLAILVANHQPDAFKYWHGDDGGWIFAVAAIAVYVGISWYLFILPLLKE